MTKKKETPIIVIKETFGDIPIEEALKEAFEPYFSEDSDSTSKYNISCVFTR